MSVDFLPTLSSKRSTFLSPDCSFSEAAATPRARGYITGFRDRVIKHVHADDDNADIDPESPSPHLSSQEKSKLIIILVGLPGRGKTFLCNKLICYLNWCDIPPCCAYASLRASRTYTQPCIACRLGHQSRHFNVGAYRRKIKVEEEDEQDANFFDPDNEVRRFATRYMTVAGGWRLGNACFAKNGF